LWTAAWQDRKRCADPGGLGALHFPFPPPGCLVGDFGPVVRSPSVLVARREADLAEGGPVRSELVRHHHGGREALLLQELAHRPQRSPLIAPSLHEEVDHLAFMIDGAEAEGRRA
jgi:hypothetical protein